MPGFETGGRAAGAQGSVGRKRVRAMRWTPLVLALVLAGCVTPGAAPGGGGASSAAAGSAAQTSFVSNVLQGTVTAIAQAAVVEAGGTLTVNNPGAASLSGLTSLAPLAPGTRPLPTRDPRALAALMGRSVTGGELYAELTSMRQAMRQQRSAAAVASFMGHIDNAKVGEMVKGNFWKVAGRQAVKIMIEQAKQQAVSMSMVALDQHLAMLTDTPDGKSALGQETLQMPKADGMSPQQMQRAVTMAAMVAAARVTNRVLKKAQNDFASIESGYNDLLERREKAATLLYQTLMRGPEGLSQIRGTLRPGDLEFLQGTLSKMTLAEFSKDLAAQNLALSFMSRIDPESHRQYVAQRDKMLPAAAGYVRTVSGSVAFAAMLVIFTQEISKAIEEQTLEQIATLLPMAWLFVTEAPPLFAVAFDAATEGVKLPFKAQRRFRVAAGDGATVELASAADVFAEIQKRSADAEFRNALFRDENGWLRQLYQCSPVEAARMVDSATAVSERERFAREYFGAEQPRFSLASLLEIPAGERSGRQLSVGEELVRGDFRARVDRRDRIPLSELQKRVADEGGYRRWSDEQLLRLIFANRARGEGMTSTTVVSTLTVSDAFKVRPIATAQAVYAYESLVDACRPLMEGTATSRATPPAPSAAAPSPVRTAPRPPAVRPPAARPPAAPPATPAPPR